MLYKDIFPLWNTFYSRNIAILLKILFWTENQEIKKNLKYFKSYIFESNFFKYQSFINKNFRYGILFFASFSACSIFET